MPDLETGKYQQNTEKTVTYWPAPDKDGDGEEVWEDRYDNNGNSLGRHRVKDAQGNEIYHYEPPKGFENRPGFDHTDNYVRVSERGQIIRDPNGLAINIRPGTALVEYADGRTEVLTDEYTRYMFEKGHEKVSGSATKRAPAKKAATPSAGDDK
jgi:hypothetical protein